MPLQGADGPLRAVPESGRQSFSIDAANEFDPLFEDVYDWCELQDLDLDTLIHEDGPAQMEINFRHGDALDLADQITGVQAHHARSGAQAQRGGDLHGQADRPTSRAAPCTCTRASWTSPPASTIFADADGNHERAVPAPHRWLAEVHPEGAADVRAQRQLVPPLPAGHLGTGERRNGAKRTAPWACAYRMPAREAMRVENRLPGADANPYLAIAASLLCGYMGMVEGLEPERARCVGRGYERRNLRLPMTIEDALERRWKTARTIEPLPGQASSSRGYVAVKRAEHENFKRVISSWEREFLLFAV